MHVVVYAICKNEAPFVERWLASMAEADQIVVLDTGSTDDTVPLLRAKGAEVTVGPVAPWRFDEARNRSLALVPAQADICVCTDLDEVFRPGWRAALEKVWHKGCSQARYRYTWSFQDSGAEGVVYWGDKIHSRHGWRWAYPVHEVLLWSGPGRQGPVVDAEGVCLDHHPDPAKSRSQYLPLLELGAAERPQDSRALYYLGREYLYQGRWDECMGVLERYLALPGPHWREERAAAMGHLGRCCAAKGQPAAARDWYLRAIAEAPRQREAYVDLAALLYTQEDWEGVLYFTGCALAIRQRSQAGINSAESWGSLPHDLRAIAYYHTGRPRQALEESRLALALAPGDARLQGNVALLEREARNR